ncbi:membrane protein insertion efficiency factor YidD [Desulfoluna spongiiphila]|nr:membrane protein insertion efficiency factor YidD [Desulfoluna spongiiphila]
MRKQLKRVFCLMLVSGLFLPGPCLAEAEESPLVYSLFKSLISSTDGNRCSHVPSCARYAREAVETHGPLKGALLSCDRLIRCGGDDTKRLPQVVVGGHRHAWDPVSANDFWWKEGKGQEARKKGPELPMHFEGWD